MVAFCYVKGSAWKQMAANADNAKDPARLCLSSFTICKHQVDCKGH